ncbi:MAG: ATP-binding protein [Nitrospira sp.]
MKKQTWLSWSSGKDSAWTLEILRQMPEITVTGLFTTVNARHQRVAMHAVRLVLLRAQAESVGLPIRLINIPDQCSNVRDEEEMKKVILEAESLGVTHMAFGDLFLQDIRAYCEAQLLKTGIKPLFPLWQIPTRQLSRTMISSGLRAIITCIDPRQLSPSYVGREFNDSFLSDLPETVDPCGERGEFHSFAVDGPMFNRAIEVYPGEIVKRDGFIFADLTPKYSERREKE